MRIFILILCVSFPLACKQKKAAPAAAPAVQASAADTMQSGWTGLKDQVDTSTWQVKDLD